jgi:uncharacterized protein
MDAFPIEVHENLKWYVYRLIDPRNGNTFYVGKGRRDRVFEHARGVLEEETDQNETGVMGLKNGLIQDIRRAGLKVLHVIHRHGLASPELAYEVEAALIDAYPGLTNLVGGHRSAIFGCRSVEQIASEYAASPLSIKEPLILIFVGKTAGRRSRFIRGRSRHLEDVTSEGWQQRLVLAYDGVLVIGAYRPKRWMEGTKANFPFVMTEDPKRIGFEGEHADVWDEYVGKRVPPRAKGAANPIKYLTPIGEDDDVE